MYRFLLPALLAAACVGAYGAPSQKPDPAASVYAELGLPAPPVFTPLADEYLPDSVTLADVRREPKRYPVRAAVLNAVEMLEHSRDTVPTATVLRQSDAFGSNARKFILNLQERPAIDIALLDEVKLSLAAVESKRPKERSRRWQSHCEYVSAEVAYRLAQINEYGEMLAVVRRDDMPAIEGNQIGWRLVPTEKMKSKSDMRKLAAASRERFHAIIDGDPHTPWALLAERYSDSPPGFQWLPTTDLIDP